MAKDPGSLKSNGAPLVASGTSPLNGGRFAVAAFLARNVAVVSVLLLGLLATSVVYLVASHAVEHDRQTEFESLANYRINTFRSSVRAQLGDVHSLKALFGVAPDVGRAEFARFAAELMSNSESMQTLEWVPRVEHESRQAWEERARREGLADFIIRERGLSGGLRPATTRPEYFPVYYVEPVAGNEPAIGFDLASNPVRRAAIERARETRLPSSTGRVTLVQETDSQFGALLFFPVFDRDGQLKGFVLGVLRAGSLLQGALAHLRERRLEVTLFDATAPEDSSFLARFSDGVLEATRGNEPLQAGPGKFVSAGLIHVADREWIIQCRPVPGSSFAKESMAPLLALLVGLIVTALLSGFLAYRSIGDARARHYEAQLTHLSRVATTGELAASLAHELTQPLCAIVLNAQSARRLAGDDPGSASGPVQDALDRIVADGERAGKTIGNIRAFLSRGTGERRAVAIESIVREAVAMVEAGARSVRSIGLQVDPALPRVFADPVQIQQVLVNLALNGIESMEAAGQSHRPLTVSVSRNGAGFVAITVEDEGRGLEGLSDEQLFSPFFTTKEHGMGIGLSLCRSIIESHGGKISGVSSGDGGARFVFSLPVVEEV
ncbi:hypothetical protein DRQ53_09435 [bacterium]|nr:MAG: hypothetical protein DRQ53_09435 [bacterium]